MIAGNYIPTVQEAIKFIDCWIEFYNSKPCPNDRSKTIQEMLNGVQADCRQSAERSGDTFNAGNQAKQDIDKNILNDLMMKTEARTINKHGITFLGMHYRSDVILGLRDKVYVRYSLFDLSKVANFYAWHIGYKKFTRWQMFLAQLKIWKNTSNSTKDSNDSLRRLKKNFLNIIRVKKLRFLKSSRKKMLLK